MGTLIRSLVKLYRFLNEEVADPRTSQFFLMGTPWPMIGILAAYFFFIFKLGPSLMLRKEPYKIERIMQLYNVTQIVMCGILLYKALVLGWLSDYSFVCQPVDYSDDPRAVAIARTVWLYFMVKILDLLDTVFFVLRKKQNQISFLHVYHHAGMVFGSWAAVKYLAGGHVTFLGLVNSFVHIVMYSHYLATSFKVSRPWWKKYITQLQLTQFFLILIHFSQLIWVEDCGFPRWPTAVFIPQNVFMIVLFGDFYYKTYIKKPRKTEMNGVSADAKNGKPKTQ